MKKPELLAPVGSFPALISAINAGADAVYLGLKEFNMRNSARNFSISELKRIRGICKKQDIKVYLTLNTIIYDNEIKKLEKIIKQIKSKNLTDAIICWDLSVIQLCKKYKIPFHISTQASISNSKSAEFYKKLGAQRIILARELNLKQIKNISKIIPIEIFIHGAMCVSVSGRCFTSQFLFNKSANRGQCMHPCRREYTVTDEEGNNLKVKNNYIFSAKDLCSLPFIEKLKKSGISSFKIEGRNRSPEYVDIVVRVYRKAIDKKLTKEQITYELNELKKVYNKGFSSGFLIKTPTSDDFSNKEHSSSTQNKQFIGKIEHHFSKKQVAAIKILTGELNLGDEILIIGNKTGVRKHIIERMEINKKSVKKAKKPQYVGIKIPGVKENDEVYKIIKRN